MSFKDGLYVYRSTGMKMFAVVPIGSVVVGQTVAAFDTRRRLLTASVVVSKRTLPVVSQVVRLSDGRAILFPIGDSIRRFGVSLGASYSGIPSVNDTLILLRDVTSGFLGSEIVQEVLPEVSSFVIDVPVTALDNIFVNDLLLTALPPSA